MEEKEKVAKRCLMEDINGYCTLYTGEIDNRGNRCNPLNKHYCRFFDPK